MSIDRLIDHARLAIDEGDQKMALDIVKAAVARDPLNASALALAGRLFRLKSQYDRSRRFLTIAATASPDLWNTWADLGALHHEQRDIDAAIGYRRRALRADPLAKDNLQALGAALVEARCLGPAMWMYRRALIADPASEATRIGYANALIANGETRELTVEAGRLANTLTRFAAPQRGFVDQLLRARQFGAAELVLEPVLRGLLPAPRRYNLHHIFSEVAWLGLAV